MPWEITVRGGGVGMASEISVQVKNFATTCVCVCVCFDIYCASFSVSRLVLHADNVSVVSVVVFLPATGLLTRNLQAGQRALLRGRLCSPWRKFWEERSKVAGGATGTSPWNKPSTPVRKSNRLTPESAGRGRCACSSSFMRVHSARTKTANLALLP